MKFLIKMVSDFLFHRTIKKYTLNKKVDILSLLDIMAKKNLGNRYVSREEAKNALRRLEKCNSIIPCSPYPRNINETYDYDVHRSDDIKQHVSRSDDFQHNSYRYDVNECSDHIQHPSYETYHSSH